MLIKNRKRWGNQVRIIGIAHKSDCKSTINNHLISNGWKEVEQFIRCPDFTADKTYSINKVPTVLLFDKNGKLVYFGLPYHRDLENDIDCLIDGK